MNTTLPSTNRSTSRLRRLISMLTIAVLAVLCPALILEAAPAGAATVPQGFQDGVTLSGLNLPTNVEFSPDGRVFVNEKRGVLKAFDSLNDPSPDVVIDLRTKVNSYWDRGLLGLALDPQFPAQPYVYVSYTYDHQLGSAAAAPLWGTANTDSDTCPEPEASTTGCVVSARVSRLTLAGNTATNETVLVEDWCAMYPSHSIGDLAFGPDGALYAGGGDGASFTFGDTGQGPGGNQCNDPVGPGGVVEGGVLRSQDIETPNDPTALNGTIIRIDPQTGAGRAGNPYIGSADANKQKVLAYGLRNPYRFTFRPGTNELYTTDIGWGAVEEINRINDVTAVPANTANNFGWPCYEGALPQPAYSSANLAICTSLYSRPGAVTAPVLTYSHTDPVVNGDGCPAGSSAPTGLAFYSGTSYPAKYHGAMFFADFARQCIWSVLAGPDGRPDPSTTALFASGAMSPVELESGPNGDLFYLEIIEGTLRRISYVGGNKAPVVTVSATKTSGVAPLTTTFTATATDPDGDPVTFAWDTDDDGQFDDGTGPTKTATYPTAGVFTPAVQGRDPSGATTIARAVVSVGTPQTQLPPPTAANWTANGGATFNACGVLLNDANTQFASANAWLNATIPSASITASFDTIIGPGTGADGMTFSIIDGAQPTSVNGGGGGKLGYGGLPGVAVALDTFQGVGDPSANFVGLATSATGEGLNYQVTDTSIPTLRNATTHVDVVITGGRLRVFVAGREVIDTTVTLPPTVRIGFTAGTGGLADAHSACNVTVSTPPLTPGNLVPSTNFVDFGQVEVGRSANNSFTWRNTGQQPVVVGTVSPPTSPFQPTTALTAGSIVAPGHTVTQSIRFQPTALGAANANFVVDPAGAQPPVTVALAGVGLQPTGPSAVITSPAPTFTWAVGDPVNFAGVASGANGQPLPASAMTWRVIMHHCSSPTVCHQHIINDYANAGSGSFLAPDHEFPSYLELKLTAVDGAQSTETNVFIQPKATPLHLVSSPPGLKLVNGSSPQASAPIDTFAITNSQFTASAPSPQVMGGITYEFAGWSDGGAASHTLTIPVAETTLTATYLPVGGNPARCGTSALPPLSAGSWVVNGGASKQGADVELTPTTPYVAGSVVSNQPVATEGLHICVDAFATGGTGADGMTVALIDPAQGPTVLGDGGSALGFAGTPGIGGRSAAVALDTFPGANEPGTDFLAIMKPGVAGYIAASAAGVPDQSLIGVPLDIRVTGGVLIAKIGTTIVTQAPVSLPPTVLVGFTAGNGAVSDQHVVRHVVVNGSATATEVPPVVTPPPPTPTPPVVTPPKYTPFQIWVFLVLWAKAIEAERNKCVPTRKKVGRRYVTVCVPKKIATRRR